MPNNSFSRRQFLPYGSFLGFNFPNFWKNKDIKKYNFNGGIVSNNSQFGHLIKEKKFPQPTYIEVKDIIIVGGGVAGLSAAWWLKRQMFTNFKLLELGQDVGGNSISGVNKVSSYPWGAHYIPILSSEAYYTRILFEELGIIQGYQKDVPIYNDFYLCADPHERLFFQGSWHEGLMPQYGMNKKDKEEYVSFLNLIDQLKHKRGSDGKRFFSIPIDLSSHDAQYKDLDKITMKNFMFQSNWHSKYLHWYINYCSRDDYGQNYDQVSAWAILHYFASRNGKIVNGDPQSVLTWPEGNGWVVNKLEAYAIEQIEKNALVFNIFYDDKNELVVDYLDVKENKTKRYITKKVIYAAPRYTAKYIVDKSIGDVFSPPLNYAPWLVANITLSKKPTTIKGQDLSWDNVNYYSSSLGYIVATHQEVSRAKIATVITYYYPFCKDHPSIARQKLAYLDYSYWSRHIVQDLEKIHPDIAPTILNLDICIWGHGMISPGLNYLLSRERQKMLEPCGPIHFAHSDMSGISIFEEAQYRGVKAAEEILSSFSLGKKS